MTRMCVPLSLLCSAAEMGPDSPLHNRLFQNEALVQYDLHLNASERAAHAIRSRRV